LAEGRLQVTTLQSFAGDLQAYSAFDPVGGFPLNLKVLEGAGFASDPAALMRDMGGGASLVYKFEYRPGAPDPTGRVTTFTVKARPAQFGKTGIPSFLMNETGAIRWTQENRDAMATDPVYGESR
jgi:hypothetical protein